MQSVDATIGPAEVCAVISFFFYGVMAVQVYLYCQSDFREDTFLIKLAVILVCIVETIHTVYIGIYIYSCTITHVGDAKYATLLVIPLQVIVGSGLVVVVVVQMFFTWRVYALSKSWIVAGVPKTVSLIRTCGMIGLRVVLPKHLTSIHDYIIDNRWLIVTLFSMTWFIDSFNTGVLVYYLVRDGTYSRKTQRMVEKIIVWTVETGILTFIFTTAMMVLMLAMDYNSIWMSLGFTVKLYSNVFFASLNGRKTLRQLSAQDTTLVLNTLPLPTVNSSVLIREPVHVKTSLATRIIAIRGRAICA